MNTSSVYMVLSACLFFLGTLFSFPLKAKETTKYEHAIEIIADHTVAQRVVVDLNQRLFNLLKDDAEGLKKDRTYLYPKLEQTTGELIDFRIIAARVMGKYYNKASEQQRADFLEVFKKNLINTYVNGLLDTQDIAALIQKLHVKIFPAKTLAEIQNKARVETDLSVDQQTYKVVYSLYLNKQTQKWLIENLEIEGINIGITLKNQFSLLVDSNHGDLNQVISSWTSEAVSTDIATKKSQKTKTL